MNSFVTQRLWRMSAGLAVSFVSVLTAWPASSQPVQFPIQQNWQYAQQPDITSGELQPQATLMSRNTLKKPTQTHQTNYGYLSVRSEPGIPLQVTLSVESRQPLHKGLDCPATGCVVSVVFDEKTEMSFKARRVKNWPEAIVLESSREFVDRATKSSVSIEVNFQDLENGASTYTFGSAKPLALSRLSK